MFTSLDDYLLFFLFSLPALVLGLWAQARVQVPQIFAGAFEFGAHGRRHCTTNAGCARLASRQGRTGGGLTERSL